MTLASRAQSSAIAVDTHAHVFLHDLPMVQGRRYSPDYDATLSAYLAHLDRTGLSHGVLVQPSFLGYDNRFLIETLQAEPTRLRGVAVVEPGVSDASLHDMDRVGIVGIRLNLFGRELPDLRDDAWPNLLTRVNALGWHVEVHGRASDLPCVLPALCAAGCRVVVDHFGRPDPTLGIDDPGFGYLLTQAASGQVWVKLSAAYRNGLQTAGVESNAHAARLLLGAFGRGRLLWGSDWPHTEHQDVASFDSCWSQLEQWITEPDDRSAILGATPSELFRI